MGDIIARSHSALKTFETCPRQYEAKYITKELPYVEGEAARWGNFVHTAMERYMRDGTPLPSNLTMYQKYADAIIKLAGKFGKFEVIVEQQIAVDPDWNLVSWFDKGVVWQRIKIDVIILIPEKQMAFVFDWKTGKYRPDPQQLALYALTIFKLYRNIEEVRCGDIWLKNGETDRPYCFKRWNDVDRLLSDFLQRNQKLDDALDRGVFPPTPNGLCNGWCEVTRCEHLKQRR